MLRQLTPRIRTACASSSSPVGPRPGTSRQTEGAGRSRSPGRATTSASARWSCCSPLSACTAMDVDYIVGKRAEADSGRIHSSARKVRDGQGNHLVDLEIAFDLRYPEDQTGDAAARFYRWQSNDPMNGSARSLARCRSAPRSKSPSWCLRIQPRTEGWANAHMRVCSHRDRLRTRSRAADGTLRLPSRDPVTRADRCRCSPVRGGVGTLLTDRRPVYHACLDDGPAGDRRASVGERGGSLHCLGFTERVCRLTPIDDRPPLSSG